MLIPLENRYENTDGESPAGACEKAKPADNKNTVKNKGLKQ